MPDGVGVEHARQFLVADFNGDGADDLFVADHGYDADPFPGQPNLLLLSSGGKLNDVTASNMSTVSSYSHGAADGDLNGDGCIDLFVNNSRNRWDERLWLNDCAGKFTGTQFTVD